VKAFGDEKRGDPRRDRQIVCNSLELCEPGRIAVERGNLLHCALWRPLMIQVEAATPADIILWICAGVLSGGLLGKVDGYLLR
jgi:hypothetical protein